MEPVDLALEKKYDAKMDFIIADVNSPEGSQLAGQYQVDLIPAIFILDPNGNINSSFVGFTPFEKLDPVIAKAIKGE